MRGRGSVLLAATTLLGLAALAVACGDLKEAATDAGATDADVADGPNGPRDATLGDGGPTADATDGSSTDAGDPCATTYPDAGAIDPEWAMWPLPPADAPGSNYTATGGVVCDRTTRLVWERGVGPVRAWDDANTYCDTLSLGGYTDWRLPTRIELLSIVDYASAPAIEATAFPSSLVKAVADGGAAESGYWAATPHPSLFLRRYVVDFEIGQAYTAVKDLSLATRCVRGGATPNSTLGITYRATTNTALDPRTGLRWQRGEVAGSPVTWSAGLQACQTLQLDGFTGFRLASIRELESLYDVRTTTGPLWDKAAFSAPNATIGAAQLWSSNVVGAQALVLSFIPNESMFPIDKTSFAGARCVKGP